ncbi:ribulose-15-bisphosphate carboxylase/oxygenase large subunit, partial [Trifolium medium]|nr:ribulose-15-bisphosphate carboxylase/oxygenase large subunit [Trifolium medium]
MVEASGMRMMMMFTNTTTLIPSFNPTIHRTTHLGLCQLPLSRRNNHVSVVSATQTKPFMETIPWGCENDSLESSSSLEKWLSES